MTVTDHMKASFAKSANATKIRHALELADSGDFNAAFAAAAGLAEKLNGVERHALSDAIYAMRDRR